MKFAGSYPNKIKDVLTAAILSGHNAVLISGPGWGKSDITRAVSLAVAGDDGMIWLPLDPATPPESIKGAYDPAKLLNGELARVTDGTPYSPKARIVIADEFARANDVVFDALVHATSRKDLADQSERPVYIATTNFAPKSERTEALRDRFALWLHIEPDLDVKGIVAGHLMNGTGTDPDFVKGLPTWQQAVDIRRSRPTTRTLTMISDYIENLVAEAKAENMEVNPRRIVQWSEILFACGVWYAGGCDWTSIPNKALEPLAYAYPTTDAKLAQKWAQIAGAMRDQIGAALEVIKANALIQFRKIASIANASERMGKVGELGRFLADTQTDICKIAGLDATALATITDSNGPLAQRDPRLIETLNQITQWFGIAVNGGKLD